MQMSISSRYTKPFSQDMSSVKIKIFNVSLSVLFHLFLYIKFILNAFHLYSSVVHGQWTWFTIKAHLDLCNWIGSRIHKELWYQCYNLESNNNLLNAQVPWNQLWIHYVQKWICNEKKLPFWAFTSVSVVIVKFLLSHNSLPTWWNPSKSRDRYITLSLYQGH